MTGPVGLLREGTVSRRSHVAEAVMRNFLAAGAEVMSGAGFLVLAYVLPLVVEPHLGAIVNLPVDVRWKFHFIAGTSFAVGIAQLFAVAKDWSRVRLWVAKSAIALSGALFFASRLVDFYGIAGWAFVFFLGNLISVIRVDARETERARAE